MSRHEVHHGVLGLVLIFVLFSEQILLFALVVGWDLDRGENGAGGLWLLLLLLGGCCFNGRVEFDACYRGVLACWLRRCLCFRCLGRGE